MDRCLVWTPGHVTAPRGRRILYWSELFWPHVGGAELFSLDLIASLKRTYGHDFLVITSRDPDDLPERARYRDVEIRRVPLRDALTGRDPARFVAVRREIARLKQSFRPDVVHLNGVTPTVLFHLQTTAAWPAAVLLRMNQEILPSDSTAQESVLGRALREADWICCVSDTIRRQLHERLPDVVSRSSTLHNGLAVPELRPAPLPRDPARLLCLGRLVGTKGFDVVLESLPAVLRAVPDARLTIAGDGPARLELEQLSEVLGVASSTDFLGWVDPRDVFHLLNTATIVVLPSRREGLPRVALQAAMMERPVVATRTSGLAEVVLHQETGVLVEKDDTRAVGEAITYLLQHPEAAAAMGRSARRRVESLFDWERCVRGYGDLYQKLARPRRSLGEAQAGSGLLS